MDAGVASNADAASTSTDAASADSATADAGKPNIVALAAGDSRFTSLVAAVKKAGLVDALGAPGPLTVFAPTNDAFAAALASLGKALDQLSADDLKPILTYHVIGSAVKSTDLKPGPVKMLKAGSAPTLLTGKNLTVDLTNGVLINSSKVVIADIVATNGVIHVIDTVLIPST